MEVDYRMGFGFGKMMKGKMTKKKSSKNVFDIPDDVMDQKLDGTS